MQCVNRSKNPKTTIVPLPVLPCVLCACVVLSTLPAGTSDYSTTSISTPSPSPRLTPGGVPVDPDSYVLPAAISVVAVLLVTVLTAIFVVVICIITRRHKTRKSLDTQRLSSIHYRSTQSDVTFEDKFHTGINGEVSIHDANGAVDKDHNSDIGETTHSYGALGPSESTGTAHIVQGAAEEPVAEGDISRPTSQASIRSNEVSSKPTLGMVVQAHPSMLDHPYDSCNWENTTVGCDGGGHNETSLNYQHAEGLYDLPPDYKLTDQEATADDSHKVLQNDKGNTFSQVGTTHQPPPQAPPSVLPTVESAYADTIAEAPEKRREPSPCSPTYDSVDLPSSTAMPAAAQSSKQHSSRPKPSPSAKSPRVPHEDHIYSVVDKSHKKSASSTSSPPAHFTHTSSTTAKGAVPTQEATMDHVYAAVDHSKKKLRRGKKN